ncbi:MAG: hypothetical protein ACOVNW_00325, partial [Flavobacterium sp.]
RDFFQNLTQQIALGRGQEKLEKISPVPYYISKKIVLEKNLANRSSYQHFNLFGRNPKFMLYKY